MFYIKEPPSLNIMLFYIATTLPTTRSGFLRVFANFCMMPDVKKTEKTHIDFYENSFLIIIINYFCRNSNLLKHVIISIKLHPPQHKLLVSICNLLVTALLQKHWILNIKLLRKCKQRNCLTKRKVLFNKHSVNNYKIQLP